jgi:hypothetical protein
VVVIPWQMAIAEHSITESLAKKALLISFEEELPSPGAQSNLNHNKYLLKALHYIFWQE